MLELFPGDQGPGAVTSWSLRWLPGNIKVMTRLQEVTGKQISIFSKMSNCSFKAALTDFFGLLEAELLNRLADTLS